MTHFTMARELVETLPDSGARDIRELRTLNMLRHGLIALGGPGDKRLPELLDRASGLYRRTARDAQLASVLRTLAFHHAYVGHMAQAIEIGEHAWRWRRRRTTRRG